MDIPVPCFLGQGGTTPLFVCSSPLTSDGQKTTSWRDQNHLREKKKDTLQPYRQKADFPPLSAPPLTFKKNSRRRSLSKCAQGPLSVISAMAGGHGIGSLQCSAHSHGLMPCLNPVLSSWPLPAFSFCGVCHRPVHRCMLAPQFWSRHGEGSNSLCTRSNPGSG